MFKKPRQEIFVGYDDRFKVGDYVKVEADRGGDLGKLLPYGRLQSLTTGSNQGATE